MPNIAQFSVRTIQLLQALIRENKKRENHNEKNNLHLYYWTYLLRIGDICCLFNRNPTSMRRVQRCRRDVHCYREAYDAEICRQRQSKVSRNPRACSSAPVASYQSDALIPARNGFDACLSMAWSLNLETTLIYAHADIEYKRRAMNHAFRNTDVPGITLDNYTVTDEELLKRLYGL